MKIPDEKQQFLEKRLAKYGAMSVALAAISLPQVSYAGSWNAGGITTTNDLPTVYFNVVTGDFGYTPETDSIELWTDAEGQKTAARFLAASSVNPLQMLAASASSFVKRLPKGASVGTNLTFGQPFSTLASNSFNPAGQWNNFSGYSDIGFSILEDGDTYYGWADISVDPQTYSITLNSFGVGDQPGAPVVGDTIAAATPEPASFVLLCLGAAGMAAYRRKTRQA